jgi:hypothetical protein
MKSLELLGIKNVLILRSHYSIFEFRGRHQEEGFMEIFKNNNWKNIGGFP